MTDFEVKRLTLPISDAATLQELAALTSPQYHSFISPKKTEVSSTNVPIAIAAYQKGKPIGLLLAQFNPILRLADMYSLYVLEAYRNKHAANEMIALLEKELIVERCLVISYSYVTDTPTTSSLEHLLQELHWAKPKPFKIYCEFDAETFHPAWYEHAGTLPDGFTEFLWEELTEEDKHKLSFQETQGVFPVEVSPFNSTNSDFDSMTSLGMRYEGEVIGWMITHRTDSNTLAYTALFIQKEYQKQPVAIHMLANAIKRQVTGGIRWGTLELNLNHVDLTWKNFVEHRLIPYASKVIYTSQIWRLLKETTVV